MSVFFFKRIIGCWDMIDHFKLFGSLGPFLPCVHIYCFRFAHGLSTGSSGLTHQLTSFLACHPASWLWWQAISRSSFWAWQPIMCSPCGPGDTKQKLHKPMKKTIMDLCKPKSATCKTLIIHMQTQVYWIYWIIAKSFGNMSGACSIMLFFFFCTWHCY